MVWTIIDNGATIGTRGSKDGVIERDEEHPDGARITLERDCANAPFSITCGIYGWMFHTSYFGAPEEAREAFEAMKAGLADILSLIPLKSDPEADAKCQHVANAIQDFVARFP
jgi:hypothetical protein